MCHSLVLKIFRLSKPCILCCNTKRLQVGKRSNKAYYTHIDTDSNFDI